MVLPSVHLAIQASTREEMNASRALTIRIRTPTHLRGPGAIVIMVTAKSLMAHACLICKSED